MCQYYDHTVNSVNAVTTVVHENTKQGEFDISSKTRILNLMLIGCGPHAKRVYIPALYNLKKQYDNLNLKVVVELDDVRDTAKTVAGSAFDDVNFLFTAPFSSPYRIPKNFEKELDNAVEKYNINGVIIATEPTAHMQYALWAQGKGLHILMDKPISTHKNASNSLVDAGRLSSDFTKLSLNRDPTRAFIINAQRRYHPGFQLVLEKINEIASEYHIPITAMQSSHCDGQWRFPKEMLTQQYHPYIGYGKVSHSGYHLIDVIGRFVQSSFLKAGKTFDQVGVYSSFVRPTGLLKQQSREDYLRIFGKIYERVNEYSDEELAELYRKAGEAEVDSSSVITLRNKGHATANISLNLMHNGFARRNWILPGEDLYKGNGRVKHEYHNIEQGPYQNIQIHSYQANDKHQLSSDNDYDLGGNNHFDIYIFRNTGVVGGEPLQVIRSSDIASQMQHDSSKLIVEQVKHRVVQEFIEIMQGEREPTDTESDLIGHALSTNLMSLIYRSGIKRKEMVVDYV